LEDRTKNYLLSDVGVYWQVNESFDVAFTTENLLYTMNDCRTMFYVGTNYQLLSSCKVLLETGSDFRKAFHVSAGIEYEIVGQFAVRCGFRSNPKTPSLGFAYIGKHWNVETAFLLHPILGLSSAIGLNYLF
jgi:hypothetical protein